jgi:hypothetical protein
LFSIFDAGFQAGYAWFFDFTTKWNIKDRKTFRGQNEIFQPEFRMKFSLS